MNADEWMETMWTTYRNGMMSDPALNKTLDEATALARKDFLPVIAKYNFNKNRDPFQESRFFFAYGLGYFMSLL